MAELLQPLAPPLPRHLQLEVTSACNLSCAMCLVSYRPRIDRATGAFSMELFRRLRDEPPSVERLPLQGLGEPLLQPHLMEMVELATARGIEVGFTKKTNMLNLARPPRPARAASARG